MRRGRRRRAELVDFGDDEYTDRPRPPDDRPRPAAGAAGRGRGRPATGVVLLDVVLGHGAEDDPAASLAPAIDGVRPPVVSPSSAPPTTPRAATARSPPSSRPAPRSTCPTPAPPGGPSRSWEARREPGHAPASSASGVDLLAEAVERPGRRRHPGRLAAAAPGHRGRPRHRRARPAPPRRQRPRARADAGRPGASWSTSLPAREALGLEAGRVPARRARRSPGTAPPDRSAAR